MSTKYPTCSEASSERSNPQAEALASKPASRNPSELDSASLHLLGVTNLPDMLKSVINEEAILECIRWTPRGDWRQRAGKEKSRNLRDPQGLRMSVTGEVNSPLWKSDTFIVARKGLTSLERREVTVNTQPLKRYGAA